MHDTGYRRTTSVIDVRHRAGDSACRRDTAEERHDDVRRALRDELCVRVMLVADHTICHDSRQQ